MVFVLDNYDSFTYNLVQYLGELGAEVEVRRNDQVTVTRSKPCGPERIVISPGPMHAPGCRHQHRRDPPLRRQSAGARRLPRASGHRRGFWRQRRARSPPDARQNQPVMHDNKTIFRGLPMPITATRYHSLIVEEKDLPANWK